MWKYYVFTCLFHFTFLKFIFREVCWLYCYFQYPTWGFRKTYLEIFLFSFIFIFGRAKIHWHYVLYKCWIWLVKISVHQNSYLQNRTTSVHNTQQSSVLKRNKTQTNILFSLSFVPFWDFFFIFFFFMCKFIYLCLKLKCLGEENPCERRLCLLSNFIYSFILSEAITNICTCSKFWTTCTFHFVLVLSLYKVTGSVLKTYLYK